MALAALLTTACNKDEVILDDRDHAPVITLDSESGVFFYSNKIRLWPHGLFKKHVYYISKQLKPRICMGSDCS